MMYEGLRIKTPKAEWIKEEKDKKGKTCYSFLYNYSKKNVETGKYEIAERYKIHVTNIKPNGDSEIIMTKHLSSRPIVSFGKDGKQYLVGEYWIEADNVSQPKLSRYQDHVPQYNGQQSTNNNSSGIDTSVIDDSYLPF